MKHLSQLRRINTTYMSRWLISFQSFKSKRRGQRQTYACTHISTAHNDLIQFDVLLHSLSAKSIESCLKVLPCVSTWLSCSFKGESVVRLVTTSFYFDKIKTTQTTRSVHKTKGTVYCYPDIYHKHRFHL